MVPITMPYPLLSSVLQRLRQSLAFLMRRATAYAGLSLIIALPALAAPQLEDGYDAFDRGDVAQAVTIWRELAEEGNQTAQLNLGQLYRTGRGVPQDDAEAVKWYVEAGRSGSEMARYTLMLMHKEGRASEDDVARAFSGETPLAATPSSTELPTTATVAGPAPKPAAASAPAPVPAATATAADVDHIPSIAAATDADRNKPRPLSTREWLDTLPVDGYVVQLIGSSRPDRLQAFQERELTGSTPEPRIVLSYLNGKNWYLLLMGPYASAADAQTAVAALPGGVQKNQPWVRPVSSLPIARSNAR